MAALQEMARLVREELVTLIQPVQLLSVNPNQKTGAVTGRFRSNGLLFDYNIGSGRVRYKPVGASGSRSDAANMSTAQLVAELQLSRKALQGRWQRRRLDGYRAVAHRLDAKNCNAGYGCGSTCIERSKECHKASGGAAKELNALVAGNRRPKEKQGTSQTERRIAAKTAQRDRIAKQLVSDLSRSRPDGMGNYIEHPDAAAMKRIKTVGSRMKKLDRELNVLEGKDPDEKRWLEGDPYGLEKYSDFQSPGRSAYEKKVIAKELQGATKGDQAVFMSGGPASGKTSLLKKQFGEAEGFAVVDPDRIKAYDPVMEIGVALGMRKAAALAHENSSRLSKELYAAARDQGFNVLMDGTGANAGKYIGQMQELKGKGYTVTLLAQHVPEEVGVQRAVKRAERTGRYVPAEFIQHAYEVIPGNFERIALEADRATLNDGQSNQVIMQYQGGRLTGGDRKRMTDYRRRYGKP
jgi:predicted ABC-type ATPase